MAWHYEVGPCLERVLVYGSELSSSRLSTFRKQKTLSMLSRCQHNKLLVHILMILTLSDKPWTNFLWQYELASQFLSITPRSLSCALCISLLVQINTVAWSRLHRAHWRQQTRNQAFSWATKSNDTPLRAEETWTWWWNYPSAITRACNYPR